MFQGFRNRLVRGLLLVVSTLLFALLLAPVAIAAGSRVYVRGYYRSSGTFVQPHYRTAPDKSFWNNWSSQGNINPYTGAAGTRTEPTYRAYRAPAYPTYSTPTYRSYTPPKRATYSYPSYRPYTAPTPPSYTYPTYRPYTAPTPPSYTYPSYGSAPKDDDDSGDEDLDDTDDPGTP